MDEHRRGDALLALAFRLRGALLLLPAYPVALWALTGPPPGPSALEVGVGLSLVGLGGWLRLLAVRHIGKRARVVRARAPELIRRGPFAWSRNPLYLAASGVVGGLAVLAGGGALAPLAALACLAVYHFVVLHEERTLSALFGDEYEAYRRDVARWVGPSAHRVQSARPAWSWSEVLGRERGLLAGLPALVSLVLAARLDLLAAQARAHAVAEWLGAPLPAALAGALAAIGLGLVVTTERRYRRHLARRSAAVTAARVAAPLHTVGAPAGTE